MKEMKLDSKVIDSVKKEVVNEVRKEMKMDLKKIVLYGSCARGDFTEDSDIDIALLTECDRAEVKKYADTLAKIATDFAMKYFVIVNFVCLPIQEFDEKKNWYPYFHNIMTEGECLYG